MPKDISVTVQAQIDAEAKRPVLLYELGLSSTLCYVANMSNVVFPSGVTTYTAKAIEVGGVRQSLEQLIGKISVKFDNVLQDMAAYANSEEFGGKSLIIKRVYLDQLSGVSDYVEIFNGIMEEPSEINAQWLTVSATSGKPFNKKALKFAYQRMCPWIFGGDECNTDGNADLTVLTASGTADSGTTIILVDSALTQATDYWNFGEIVITYGGDAYRRKVVDFFAVSDAVHLDVAVPFTIDNTCDYTIYKGCDQTWDTCSGTNVWGPSADNALNFGGVIHVPAVKDSNIIIEDIAPETEYPGVHY